MVQSRNMIRIVFILKAITIFQKFLYSFILDVDEILPLKLRQK